MTTEQTEKYAYCENKNNQNVIFPKFRKCLD